ncbi:MAG: glycosyltransferase family 2 protein [Candidatus Latescibacterota bacterium]|jgi:GT2 family glycosyltransferase
MTEAGGVGSVDVALANWNGRRYLSRCLDALLAQTVRPASVVVVDNGSTDGSRELMRQAYPGVILLENDRNLGFAAGYNRAIAAGRQPAVLVLNTDVFLAPDFVERTLTVLERHADLGSVTGRIFQEGTGQWLNGGFFLRPQVRIAHSPNLEVEEEVFGCTGAVMLCRRAMLDAVRLDDGYFDETYFSYGEDIDLAWRAQLAGWRARYQPEARAWHVGSGSLEERLRFIDKPPLFQRHLLKNRYLTLVKNLSPGLALRLLPGFLLAEPLVWAYLLVRRPLRFPYLLLALRDAAVLLPDALSKRRRIQAGTRMPIARLNPLVRRW